LEMSESRAGDLGQLHLSLTYIPNLDRVKLTVFRAKDLKRIDLDNDRGVYVRIEFFHGSKCVKTRKTNLQRISSDPCFNECFPFKVLPKQLESCSLTLSVIVPQRSRTLPLLAEVVYGKITLGSFLYSRGVELQHWQKMASEVRTPIARWHSLTRA